MLYVLVDLVQKAGGPYIGPRGGKWADPQHKVPWKEPTVVPNPDEEVPTHLRASPYIRVRGGPSYERDMTYGNVRSTRSAYRQAQEHGIELESYKKKLALLSGSDQHLLMQQLLKDFDKMGSKYPEKLAQRMRANLARQRGKDALLVVADAAKTAKVKPKRRGSAPLDHTTPVQHQAALEEAFMEARDRALEARQKQQARKSMTDMLIVYL